MHQRQIIKIGNSLGVTVPADYLHRMDWKVGDLLQIDVYDSQSIRLLKPSTPPKHRGMLRT